ncbi:MAG: hypothetical protein EOP52_12930 [Sphingobacteriales bacterium]|nr:MAG: hypothetical protein EOP52_12930 [Sphingobacteriales bacterium]
MNKNLPLLFRKPFNSPSYARLLRGLRRKRNTALLITCMAPAALLQPSEASVQKILKVLYQKA